VILPGTKAVRQDLAWLVERGLARQIVERREAGGRVAGICGGYQMLGRSIHDPEGVEGSPGSCAGLGLLTAETTFAPEKRLTRVEGRCRTFDVPVSGYEIHAGTTRSDAPPFLEFHDAAGASLAGDGAVSPDGRVFGTYLHGLFDSTAFVRRLLELLGVTSPRSTAGTTQNEAIDRLTAHFRRYVDVAAIEGLVGHHGGPPSR
jgi:adenosylcobyric acid synthase